jgi:PAS domain S-box-containing protein
MMKIIHKVKSVWSPALSVAVITATTIFISIYCLLFGWVIVFQNIFYVPIIIACMYYAKKGLVFSVGLSFVYLALILAFTRDHAVIFQAVIRTIIFVGVAGVVAELAVKRRQAEEKSRKAELYARSLIEASLDALVTIGSNGRITDVNKATEEATGVSRDHLIGSDFSGYFSEPEKAQKGYQQVFSKGLVKDYQLTMKNASGKLMDVMYNATIFRDESERVQGVFAAARDVTKLKKMEDSLREHSLKLEAINKELESFAYSVSHDLRVPLRAIDGFTKIVAEDYNEKFDEEGKRLLGVIRTNTRKMGQLIEDLLLFSKVGRQELAGSEVDMNTLVQTVANDIKTQNEDRKITFKLGSLQPVKGDLAMLRQVLANLMGNAVKFTRTREEALVEISGMTKGSENIYSVKDNGVGFDMQYVSKLFGVFQRLHSQEEFEGTGVGLAIVQRVILKHGGRVWAEGKVGEGATVRFALPNTAPRQG